MNMYCNEWYLQIIGNWQVYGKSCCLIVRILISLTIDNHKLYNVSVLRNMINTSNKNKIFCLDLLTCFTKVLSHLLISIYNKPIGYVHIRLIYIYVWRKRITVNVSNAIILFMVLYILLISFTYCKKATHTREFPDAF